MAAIVTDQEHRWNTDQPLQVEDYLAQLPRLADDADCKLQLAVGEFQARQNSGSALSVEEFATRFPDQIPGTHWDYGAELETVRELVEYWRDSFDWSAVEDQLNALDNFTTTIDGQEVHFIHARSKVETATSSVPNSSLATTILCSAVSQGSTRRRDSISWWKLSEIWRANTLGQSCSWQVR